MKMEGSCVVDYGMKTEGSCLTPFPPIRGRGPCGFCVSRRVFASRARTHTGWEMQTTDQGVPYYVDHINKRTSWDPPLMSSGGRSVVASELPDIREYRRRLSPEVCLVRASCVGYI